MRTMVEVLAEMKGRLLIFGPMAQGELEHAGLRGPQVEFRGMHSPNDLIAAVRREADLLYAPIYFRLLIGHGSLTPEFTDSILEHVLFGLAKQREKKT